MMLPLLFGSYRLGEAAPPLGPVILDKGRDAAAL